MCAPTRPIGAVRCPHSCRNQKPVPRTAPRTSCRRRRTGVLDMENIDMIVPRCLRPCKRGDHASMRDGRCSPRKTQPSTTGRCPHSALPSLDVQRTILQIRRLASRLREARYSTTSALKAATRRRQALSAANSLRGLPSLGRATAMVSCAAFMKSVAPAVRAISGRALSE